MCFSVLTVSHVLLIFVARQFMYHPDMVALLESMRRKDLAAEAVGRPSRTTRLTNDLLPLGMPLVITHYPRANWLLTHGEWMRAQASPQLTPLCTAAAVGALTVQASKWYGGKGIDGSEQTSSRAWATSPKQ
jgi:hypothetical protein